MLLNLTIPCRFSFLEERTDSLLRLLCFPPLDQGVDRVINNGIVDFRAQNLYGFLLLTGEGIEKNVKEAISWFEKSLKNGHIDASFHLGNIYYKGIDVPKDAELAAKYYLEFTKSVK